MHEAPIDPDVLALLSGPDPEPGAALPEPVPVWELTIEERRQRMRDAIDLFTREADPIPVDKVVDELVPGRHGTIPVRHYGPETPTSVILYMHGGAWMIGDIDTHDLVTRRLSRDTGALVVSVDYRMLPEHPFPAPMDDAYDATVWASGLHPELPFLVAGDSAGATLAVCVCLRARDEDGPRIDGQVLVYPATDVDVDTPSMLAFASGPQSTREDIRYFLEEYVAPEAAQGNPYAMPDWAVSLEGLPPALMAIAGHDLLRSGEERFVRRLEEAGVPVTVQLDADLTHGWIDYAPRVPAADRAFTRLTDHVDALVARAATPAG